MLNGFEALAYIYEKNEDEREAELYRMIAKCSHEDICTLFDTTAFNEIAKSYLRIAVRELVEEGVINKKQAKAVRNRYSYLYSELTADEAFQKG